MDWAQILVFLLAILFAIFLVIAIALAVILMRITRQIKAAAASAERTVAALEGSVRTFRKSALPLMVTKGIINQVMKRSRGKNNYKKDEQK